MSQKDIYTYFEIILETINTIKQYTLGMDFEVFSWDGKTIDACLMQFQHLWETTNKLKTNFPKEDSLPYAEIIWFRNFIAHEYLGIDIGIVWDTIVHNLPLLEEKIQGILKAKDMG